MERPREYEKQKEYYSGKKKTHTKKRVLHSPSHGECKKHSRKGQVIVLPKGKDIVDISAGEPGKKSDIQYFRETEKKFDSKQKFSGDKAYTGELRIKTPKKKPKKRELTDSEKSQNREFALLTNFC
nr:transposase family protein [Okeania sp. SIO2C9]